MDITTLAVAIAYANKVGENVKKEGFKVQVETDRSILETIGEEKVFYFLPKKVSKPKDGYDEYIYTNNNWEQIGNTDIDLSGYMTLAPLNPTAEQIAALPVGQLYGDTSNHKGVIKDGQSFYDTVYIDENYRRTYTSDKLPPYFCSGNDTNNMGFNLGDKWVFNPPSYNNDHREYVLTRIERSGMYGVNYRYIWVPTTRLFYDNHSTLPTTEEYKSILYMINGKYYGAYALSRYSLNDVFLKNGAYYVIDAVYSTGTSDASNWVYQLRHLMSETEIDNKGYLTLGTLPIYDGTVI